MAGGQPGQCAQVAAVAFGIGALVEASAAAFTVIKLAGAADRAAGHVPVQMLLLGGVFVGIALISDSSWALVAGTARGWLARSPRRLAAIGGTGGLAMIGIGASLALTGRKDERRNRPQFCSGSSS